MIFVLAAAAKNINNVTVLRKHSLVTATISYKVQERDAGGMNPAPFFEMITIIKETTLCWNQK